MPTHPFTSIYLLTAFSFLFPFSSAAFSSMLLFTKCNSMHTHICGSQIAKQMQRTQIGQEEGGRLFHDIKVLQGPRLLSSAPWIESVESVLALQQRVYGKTMCFTRAPKSLSQPIRRCRPYYNIIQQATFLFHLYCVNARERKISEVFEFQNVFLFIYELQFACNEQRIVIGMWAEGFLCALRSFFVVLCEQRCKKNETLSQQI